MGKRQKEWSRKARANLVEALGQVCRRCGTAEALEIDCIEPQGHEHHRMDHSARTSFYRQQHKAGNVQLLCADCHSLKTSTDLAANAPITVPLSDTNSPY